MTGDSDDNEINDWMDELEGIYRDDGRDSAWDSEKDILEEYLERLREKLNDRYEMESPINMGGTAVIFSITQSNTEQKLALKFNRPLEGEADGDLTMVENESKTLPGIHHANIIRALDRGEDDGLEPKLNYLVEPLISNPQTLEDLVREKSEKIRELKRDDEVHDSQVNKEINDSLQELIPLIRQWVSAVNHLHDEGYIHLDIKPENALVDEDGHLEIIDLGSVKKYEPNRSDPTVVFFTEAYAHPSLKRDYERNTSSNRLMKSTKRSDLKYEYDYYALGSSILELLNFIAGEARHDAPQLPIFRSLHLLATRLLDGENTQRTFKLGDVANEVYGNLALEDYETLHYDNLDDVHRDLRKEDGTWNPEEEIPELNSYSKDAMRLAPDLDVALTPRLLALIEHPLFARLKMVTQLGFIRQIYPSADHSRYDHALGTYNYTTEYIKSLFNDRHNPLFRNLVDSDDIKTIMLASLLHDIGHYPLAHDLEEVNDSIFSHLDLTIDLLKDPTKDEHGRTIRDIIEDDEFGWGVDIDHLKEVLGASPRTSRIGQEKELRDFKVDLLRAVIDGPIDADKADYITRDSNMCGIPYGNQLDMDRLLRVITVARLKNSRSTRVPRVTIGVYEKGFSSARAFGQARSQLYSSVYWHHTSRIMKSMVQYATAICLHDEDFSLLGDESLTQIRKQHMEFMKKINPTNEMSDIINQDIDLVPGDDSKDVTEKPSDDVMEEVGTTTEVEESLTASEGTWHPGTSWTDYLMLHWIKRLPGSDERTASLLDDLAARNLYKRVCKIPYREAPDSTANRIRDLDWGQRLELCVRLQEEIRKAIVDSSSDDIFEERRQSGTITQSGRTRSKITQIFDEKLAILIDAPDPSDVGFDRTRPLVRVPQLKSKTYYQDFDSPKTEDDWGNTLQSMMQSAAPVRVICHPKLRQKISSDLRPASEHLEEGIRMILDEIE